MFMQVIRDLFASKKGVAAMASIGVVVANAVGLTALSEASLVMILGIVSAFILGTGLADLGKEAAKAEFEADE